MEKDAKNLLKRTAAATLSTALVFSMNVSSVPLAVYAADTELSVQQNEVQEVKIERSEITSMSAKSLGPAGDGDSLEASLDGDTSTYTNSNYLEPSSTRPQVYTFNFSTQINLSKVRIHPRNSGGGVGNGAPNRCIVEISTDGSTYTQVADQTVTDTSLTWTDIAFSAVPATSVRLTLYSAHDTVVSTGEVELYKQADAVEEVDKTELKTVIDQIRAKLAGLDRNNYVNTTWDALQAALTEAEQVYADPGAAAGQVAETLAALKTADQNLAELISPIYMTDFVSYENGRLTVELNGPTDYVPDGMTKWTYEYRDGKHLLYTDNWDDIAQNEDKTYRRVCIYDLNRTKGLWSFIYLPENGEGSVTTAYNAKDAAATLTAGGKTYNLADQDDLAEIKELRFTAVPVVHIEGINLHDVTRQRVGVGEGAVDIEVTGNHTAVDIPLISSSGKAVKGNYSLKVGWTGNTERTKYFNVEIANISEADRTALDEQIRRAEALAQEDYTEESWAAMQEKLTDAKAVLGDSIATVAQIQSAADALKTAIDQLEDKPEQVDKTALQELYDKAKEAKLQYPDKSYYEKLQDALAEAEKVLNAANATQKEVDKAYSTLEQRYWLNMNNDKVAYYNVDKQGVDGRFDYSDKITETILPIVTAFKTGRNFNAFTDAAKIEANYNAFVEAEKHIQSAEPGQRGVEIGFNEDALNPKNSGHFEITGQEFVEEDEAAAVKVFVSFINDGIDPVSGEERDEYSSREMEKAHTRLSYDSPTVSGSKSWENVQPLDGSYSKGLTGEVTIPLDSTISLQAADSMMPGYISVEKFTPADKTNLKNVLDKAKEAIETEYNYVHDSNWDALIAANEKAMDVYNNPVADKDEVEAAWMELLNGLMTIRYEKEKPEAIMVLNGTETQITENMVLNSQFDFKFTDNGKLYQFLLNGKEFMIDGTEDTVTFDEIRDVLNEGDGEDGKNILVVRDSVPPLDDMYLTENTYTFYFDQTAPELTVSYSTEELTNQDVTVKILSSEKLDESRLPNGWRLSDDGLMAEKVYEDCASEEIEFTDVAGNAVTVPVVISNIDKVPLNPGKPEYIRNHDGSVDVRIAVEEDIDTARLPEGWVYENGYIEKTFKKDVKEELTLFDKAGNESKVVINVKIPDKPDKPDKPGDSGNKDKGSSAVKTGDSAYGGFYMTLMAAGAAAAAFISRRKKNTDN